MTGGGRGAPRGVPGGCGGGFKRRGALRRRGVKRTRDTGAHGVEGGMVTCFLHQGEAGNDNEHDFVSLTSGKGGAKQKLEFIKQVRDERLQEPHDSPIQFATVCAQIPESEDDIDTHLWGYHNDCYKLFTRNRDRLQCNIEKTQAATSAGLQTPVRHSPRKKPIAVTPLSPEMRIFPNH